MDELLQRVAEIRGMPASLIERSAQARAEKEGISVEAVLAEWAGDTPATADQPTQDSEQQPVDDVPPAPEVQPEAPEKTNAAIINRN